jgi:hypothetical protein
MSKREQKQKNKKKKAMLSQQYIAKIYIFTLNFWMLNL